MNAIVNAFAEQGLVLGAILLLAIYLQAKIHAESAALRRDMSDLKDDLRKDMSSLKDDLRKEMSEMKDTLREDIGNLGQRVARLEGPLPRGAPYDAVAEPSADEAGKPE